jgi:hypothetical protein
MRLSGTKTGAINQYNGLGDQLYDLGGARPTLDLNFANNGSLVDSVTGKTLVQHTRQSNATYVDGDGVIRTATTNLLLQSEDFSTTWTNSESSENINVAVAPNGTTTADALVDTVNNSPHYVSQSVAGCAGSTSYTFSCYMKKGSKDFGSLIFGPNASWGTGGGASVFFDLTNGTISASTSATGTIQALPNGWYRCTATATTVASPGTVFGRIGSSLTGSAQTYEGNGDEAIYLWGAQLEQSSTVGEYIPTTSTINSAPRFDHDPTTGESLGLLVEESRTNLVANSSATGAAIGTPGTLPTGWSAIGGATGLTSEIAAVGTENGIPYVDFRFYGTTGNNFLTITPASGNLGFVTNTSYAFSVYTKLVAGAAPAEFTASLRIRYNLSPSGSTDIVTNFAMPSAGGLIANRKFATGTTTGTLTGTGLSFLQLNYSSSQVVDFTIRVGYPQLEQGAFATSVIPTTGAAATRAADVASISGSNFSSWYRQDEGTMFADFNGTNITSGQFPRILEFNDGTSSNLIRVQQYGANAVRASVVTATATQFAADNGSVAVGVRGKTAFGSALNDAALVTNGASPTTDATYLVPSGLTQLGIGSPPGASTSVLNSTIRRLTYWPQRLSNDTLQTITV